MLAAAGGHVHIAEILILAGADVNRLSNSGLSALCEAASNGSDEAVAVMRVLLLNGAEIDYGRPSTPLMCACVGSFSAMKTLLDGGADPNATRPRRGTALHVCVEINNLPGARLLFACGADPSIPGPQRTNGTPGLSALELAQTKGLKAIVALLTNTPFSQVNNGRERILDLLDEVSSDENYKLRPGATVDLVEEFQSTIDLDVPQLLLDMYWRADGQEPSADLPLLSATDYNLPRRGFFFLQLSEVLTDWRNLTKALERGTFDHNRNLNPDPGVKRAWWDKRWIPLFYDRNGTYVCLDFAPTEEGTAGQIILFEHDSPRRRLLAINIELFFSKE
jgi:cell wall assembly regulator SMI1